MALPESQDLMKHRWVPRAFPDRLWREAWRLRPMEWAAEHLHRVLQ